MYVCAGVVCAACVLYGLRCRCTLLNKKIRKAMQDEQTVYTADCGKFVHGKGVCQRIQSEQAGNDIKANGLVNGHANGHANGHFNGHVYVNGHAESPRTPNGVH